ncbi:MAG: hypothetical protein CVU84_08855 [Firmicutes bacterium HGW-Firmicutes-1]|nr:MAG: hypothetical protein CVU84_08855 [Firmicutes bacterium HGW-Firmicutes-1]
MLYVIVISGYIQETWFEELIIIKQPNLTTKLCGHFIDQSALYGVLRKINDLGIDLISVNHIEDEFSYEIIEDKSKREDNSK